MFNKCALSAHGINLAIVFTSKGSGHYKKISLLHTKKFISIFNVVLSYIAVGENILGEIILKTVKNITKVYIIHNNIICEL